MVRVNMHEAKSRLSELVRAVAERNETIVLCRDGVEVAEIRRRLGRRRLRNLDPDPRFHVTFAPGYDPTEPEAEIRRGDETSVSSVTAWEIAIQVAAGKLQLKGPPERWFADLLEYYELREVPLDSALACAAAALPNIHRDRFDRAIVALARATGSIVVTSDHRIRQYPGVTARW